MPTTALYRISSGEVIKISLRGQSFDTRDPTIWGVLTDPTLPDGDSVRETRPDGTLGPLRQLGFAKLAITGSNTCRNATRPEIDAFEPSELDDENTQDAAQAIDLFQAHPKFRKILIALAEITRSEINILRAQHGLPPRSSTQLRNAIRSRVSKDD